MLTFHGQDFADLSHFRNGSNLDSCPMGKCLGLKMDYSIAIATLKQSKPTLVPVIEQVGSCGLHQVQQEGDPLFSLLSSIIHQQLSTKATAGCLGSADLFLTARPG